MVFFFFFFWKAIVLLFGTQGGLLFFSKLSAHELGTGFIFFLGLARRGQAITTGGTLCFCVLYGWP